MKTLDRGRASLSWAWTAAWAATALLAAAAPAQAGRLALTIEEAIETALENNRSIAIADAKVAAARARLGQARSVFFPQLRAAGSYTRLDEAPYMDASQFGDFFEPLMVPFEYLVEHGYLDPSTLEGLSGSTAGGKIYVGDEDVYSVGLTVTQPLFTGGGILAAYGAAKHAAAAEEWNGERTRDETRFDAVRAYVGLVQAIAARDVMTKVRRQVESHLSDVESLRREGMVIESELMLAKVRMAQVELELSAAEHGVELARAALCFTLGLPLETEIHPLDTLEEVWLPELDLDDWVARAVESRPDLRAMREAVGAAGDGVTAARSEYFPDLMLIGNYNWDRPNREYEPEFYDHWSVTLALEMNVFDWGRTRNRVREARAGLMQAEHGYELMRDAVRLEVTRSYLERDEALDAVRIAEDGLAQAREALRVTRESFRSGAATNSDVLDAQAALKTAEMNRVAALARLRLAEAALELAAGAQY